MDISFASLHNSSVRHPFRNETGHLRSSSGKSSLIRQLGFDPRSPSPRTFQTSLYITSPCRVTSAFDVPAAEMTDCGPGWIRVLATHRTARHVIYVLWGHLQGYLPYLLTLLPASEFKVWWQSAIVSWKGSVVGRSQRQNCKRVISSPYPRHPISWLLLAN